MAKYRVHFQSGASCTVTVEAEDEEAAIEAAYDELPGGICAQCSGWGQEWSIDLGEWDLEKDDPKFEFKAVELEED